jgi:hypothetical protein
VKQFCTLSDKKYLKQGKARIDSLKKVNPLPFELYYLCLDEETYTELEGEDFVVRVKLSAVEQSRESILKYKSRKPYNEYCWSLASTFCRYLLEEEDLSDILYIDSDIYFYLNPLIIYQELGDKSIGIIRHRHNTSSSVDGEFNVGIIYFKNDKDGRSCLRWWNDCILEDTRPDLATCGDQKYLEEFIPLYGDSVCVLDKTFAHGAPWNFRLYVYDDYPSDGSVIWGDKKQPLVFNHFSRIGTNPPSPTQGQYADHTLGFQVFNIPVVRAFYEQYLKEIMG